MLSGSHFHSAEVLSLLIESVSLKISGTNAPPLNVPYEEIKSACRFENLI